MPKKLRVRCPKCHGLGASYLHVRDDSTVSGYRTVESPCGHCVNGIVLRPMPAKPKLKGIASASVLVSLSGRDQYDHATLYLYAPADDRERGDTVFSVSFQRHRLGRDSYSACRDIYATSRPDARFDVGEVAWSPFYAGRVGYKHESGFPVDSPEALRRAAATVERINAARRELPRGYNCELAAAVDALELLGVPVRIEYVGDTLANGRDRHVYTVDALTRELQAGRIKSGVATALVEAELAARAEREAAEKAREGAV